MASWRWAVDGLRGKRRRLATALKTRHSLSVANIIAFLVGLIALVLAIVSFIPLLGWLNWLIIFMPGWVLHSGSYRKRTADGISASSLWQSARFVSGSAAALSDPHTRAGLKYHGRQIGNRAAKWLALRYLGLSDLGLCPGIF